MSKYHGFGTIIKEYKTLKPKKEMCSGCYCDEYNYGLGGAKGCWNFKDALVVDKKVYPNLNCTESQRVICKKTLSCYHGVNK